MSPTGTNPTGMKPVDQSGPAAKDVMSVEPVCIDRDMTVRQIARLLEENEISGAPVVDGHGCLVGVISRTDLLRRWTSGDADRDPAVLVQMFAGNDDVDLDWAGEDATMAEDIMTGDPVTAEESTPVSELARRMIEARVHRIIVVDRLRVPIGIVTSLDLVKVLVVS